MANAIPKELKPPGAIMPDEAFKQPTQTELEMNKEYWDGYDDGKDMRTKVNSPAGFPPEYGVYKTTMELKFYRKAADKGYPINENVGYNNCINDIINWLWNNDPTKPT